MVRQIAKQES
ncbi:hypothetical protein D039_2148A, partial [Vibrio parahaemolyticus EKP-028]